MSSCPYICDNKNELGYCLTTACINPVYRFDASKAVNELGSSSNGEISIELLCSGEGCERAVECQRFLGNIKESCNAQIINFYTYGNGEASERGVFSKSWCGPSGNWEYFKDKGEQAEMDRFMEKRYLLDKTTSLSGLAKILLLCIAESISDSTTYECEVSAERFFKRSGTNKEDELFDALCELGDLQIIEHKRNPKSQTAIKTCFPIITGYRYEYGSGILHVLFLPELKEHFINYALSDSR